MKKRDRWIAVIFVLFIFTLPAATVVRGVLPQSQAVLTGGVQEPANHNDIMQTAGTGGAAWFTALQDALEGFTESLCVRSELIAFNSELTSRLTGGTYMESTQVLLGKNNWLFYKSELDGHPLWDYMGINHFTEDELAATAARLVSARDGFNALGVDFYVITLPNKEIVYEEYMPDTIVRVDNVSRADQQHGFGICISQAGAFGCQSRRTNLLSDRYPLEPEGCFCGNAAVVTRGIWSGSKGSRFRVL